MQYIKYFLTIFSILLATVCNAENISQSITFPLDDLQEIDVSEEGELFAEIIWNGLDQESVPGRYSLPVKYLKIKVPAYSNNFSVSADNISWGKNIQTANPLHIVKGSISDNQSLIKTIDDEHKTYESGEYYKMPSVSVCKEYFLNGTEHYVLVKIIPVAIMDNNVIPCKTMDVTLSYDRCQASEMVFDVEDVMKQGTLSIEQSNLSTASGALASRDLYLIITTQLLKPACQDIAIWKKQKGYEVKLYTIEEILSKNYLQVGATTGIVDEADALRKFLKSLYSSKRDTYCLFVGPTEKLPIRYFYDSSSRDDKLGLVTYDNFVPTDVYYSDLVSKWNLKLDTTGIYTQKLSAINYSPSIYVGRLVCSFPSEVKNYMEKLLYYEAFPGKGDDVYLGRGLVTQQNQHLFYPNLIAELGTISDTIYMRDKGGTTFADHSPKGSDVIKEMRECGIISLQGHGHPGVLACSGKNDEPDTWRYIKALEEYDSTDISQYNNELPGSGLDMLDNRYYPSIIYTLSCDVMPFDDVFDWNYPYNMGTSYTIAGTYGGVAMLGNTRIGWDTYNILLEKEFASQVKTHRHIGKAHALAKTEVEISGYACAAHNIMGDPELSMWTAEPLESSLGVYRCNDFLRIRGITLPYSSIILYDGINEPAIWPAQGSTIFALGLSEMGIDDKFFAVSVWKDGYLPYIDIAEQNATLSNSKRSFIVHEAAFGADVISTKSEGDCIIGENGDLEITAIKSVRITQGFKVKNGGNAKFLCMEDIDISGGNVEKGGSLILSGENIIISNEFSVELGGTLQIDM